MKTKKQNIEDKRAALGFIIKTLDDKLDDRQNQNILFDEKELLRLIKHHRLNSLLPNSNNYKPELLPKNLARKIAELDKKNKLRMMRLSSELIKVCDLFKSNNIPFLILKGPVLSQQIYGDYALRNSRDIDVLVKKEDVFKAHQVLIEHLYRTKSKHSTIERLNHKELKYYNENTKVLIELHHRFFNNKHLLPISETIFENTAFVSINDYKIPVLDKPINYLYILTHAAAHNWSRLHWVLDIINFRDILSHSEKEQAIKTAKSMGLEKLYKQSSKLNISDFVDISREKHYTFIRKFTFLLSLNSKGKYKAHEILQRLMIPYRLLSR